LYVLFEREERWKALNEDEKETLFREEEEWR
jgi:hypothetical protein